MNNNDEEKISKRSMNLEKFIKKNDQKISISNEIKAGPRFFLRLEESISSLKSMLERDYQHWIITFSGGKDSSTCVVVALEVAQLNKEKIKRIDIVYSDTGIEIPVIKSYAINFLNYISEAAKNKKLPVKYHVIRPSIDESFWVCLLGKGYPPPHQHFRWCTKRLKIEPVERAFKHIMQPNNSLIMTGVRFGESKARDFRLYQSCKRGGECGQGIWYFYSKKLRAGYLAPIIDWNDCDVWDFLNFYAPKLGYPTSHLEDKVYNGRETRFGCWMCTVVKQDKAMEKITKLPEWSHLTYLLNFREYIINECRSPGSRIRKEDGKPGRLKLKIRERILHNLIDLEKKVNLELITEEEKKYIYGLWQSNKYGDD